MAGIMDVVGIVNNLDYRPKYERAKCIRSISHKANCSICREVCSQKAVTICKNGIAITESCNFCNECVSYCPTNALVDSGRRFVGADKEIYLLCQKHKLSENIDNYSRIECLNFLSTKILLNMYSNGCREIYTNLNKCVACQRSHKLQNELDRTNKILNELSLPAMSVINKEVEDLVDYVKDAVKIKQNTKVDRRSFFTHTAKDILGKTYEIAPPAGRVQYWRSTGQLLAKWQKNNEQQVSVYKVEIKIGRCIQCQACLKMCPHNVWEEIEDTMIFRQYLCNGCNLCKDTCPTKAIAITEDIRLINYTVGSIAKKECTLCGQEFTASITEAGQCPSCTWKEFKAAVGSANKRSLL